MKKNFLFGTLAVLLAGFWFGGASLADCTDSHVACLNNVTWYDSLTGAIDAAQNGDTVTLLDDIELDKLINVKTGIVLNLNWHDLNFSSNFWFYFNWTIDVIIEGNWSIVSNWSTIYSQDCNLTINGWNIKSNYSGDDAFYTLVFVNTSWSINDWTFESETEVISLQGGSSLTINGGTFSGEKHDVTVKPNTELIVIDWIFMSNYWNFYIEDKTWWSTVTIKWWEFTSKTNESWKIAFWLMAGNEGTVTIDGWNFNITNWVWVIARWGIVTVWSWVKFQVTGTSHGHDYKDTIEIPMGYEVVMDVAAHYPTSNPGTTLTTINNNTGTYLIAGSFGEGNYAGYVVSIKNDGKYVPLTLIQNGTSAEITKPTDPTKDGYQFIDWFNGDDATEAFTFTTPISSDVELVSKWNTVISEIDITWVEKPVAWNTATTGGIKISSGLTITNAYWTEVTQAIVNQQIIQQPTSVMSVQWLQIAQVGPEPFEWTFVEGSGYVLHVLYATGDWYELAKSVTYKINGENIDNETDEKNAVAKTYTAAAKPASSNYSGWWGGGSSKSSASSSNESKTAEKATDTAKADEQKADDAKADENKNEAPATEETAAPTPMTEAQAVAKFGQEQIDAYKWAHDKGITTMDTVEDARLDEPLTRAELAKMMVVYMAKIAKKSPVVTGTVSYPDVKAEEIGDELVGYIQLAYQFQIMWVDANGNPIEEFMPNALVTRWEYATVFSRVLFGSLFNQEWEDFYSKHIAALNAAGILTNTDPTIQEMRGWVMLMMYRSSQNLEEIAKVAAEIWATDEEVEAGKKAAEILAEEEAKAETTTWDVAEAPVAEEQAQATTWDVAEAPAVEETASAEANTWEVAAEPSNN